MALILLMNSIISHGHGSAPGQFADEWNLKLYLSLINLKLCHHEIRRSDSEPRRYRGSYWQLIVSSPSQITSQFLLVIMTRICALRLLWLQTYRISFNFKLPGFRVSDSEVWYRKRYPMTRTRITWTWTWTWMLPTVTVTDSEPLDRTETRAKLESLRFGRFGVVTKT